MNQTIEYRDDTDLDGMITEMDKTAEQGVLYAAIKQQEAARTDMRSNASGYNLGEVAEGIMVGKLKKDKAMATTKVHGFGTGEHKNLARIFIPGTITRQGVSKEGKPYTKGYIKPSDSIRKTESQAINDLDDWFRKHITTN